MSERYEASVNEALVGFFTEKLAEVLQAEGFTEALHIPRPDVTEYQRGSHVVSLAIGHPHQHRREIVVESEHADLETIIGRTVRQTVASIAEELTDFFPKTDSLAVKGEVDALLGRMLPPT